MIKFDRAPVDPVRITSPFGARNTGIAGASAYHKGIDLGANRSLPETPVSAVRDGIVNGNCWNDARGWVLIYNCVSDDGDGFRVLVQHLRERSPLKVGQTVRAGQKIGVMGASTKTIKGMAVHLHTELQVPVGNTWTPVDFAYQLEHIGEDEMTEEQIRGIVEEVVKKELAAAGSVPSAWANAWKAAEADGVTDGTRPKGCLTREEGVQIVYRALGRVPGLK